MPVPVEPTPVETESVQSAQTTRPVVAVLGEPGTRGALVKLLQNAGAQVIVTAVPNQLREADGMVVTGGASSLEAYEDLKAKDAERVIGRRVAGGRPVLVAGAALTCLFDSVTVKHPQTGQIQVQCMGEWPGESVELSTRDLVPGVSALRSASDSALLKDLEGEAHFKSEHAVFEWAFDQSIEYIAPPAVTWTVTEPAYIAAVENGPLTAVQFCPVESGELGAEFMRRWVASLAVTGRLSSEGSATAAGGN
ncbi:imidazole glycerol phosphate synthase [Rothia similmucilaginosa]|uniref:imidazole glycerol phosphate synthase n=1 Tax=unclassified Rothia (in: high G+C Gram-positive bacteria) TaxID=2689056 RepID=UPI002448AC74|nr:MULTISPECIES: imidazole glycerol phosphate synthase [unclassified Rothia (in: high G+C Gram-positive bacteria)]